MTLLKSIFCANMQPHPMSVKIILLKCIRRSAHHMHCTCATPNSSSLPCGLTTTMGETFLFHKRKTFRAGIEKNTWQNRQRGCLHRDGSANQNCYFEPRDFAQRKSAFLEASVSALAAETVPRKQPWRAESLWRWDAILLGFCDCF